MKTTSEELRKKVGDVVFTTEWATPSIVLFLWEMTLTSMTARTFVSGITDSSVAENLRSQSTVWAFSTRCRPNLNETFFKDVRGFPLVPYMGPGNGSPVKGGQVVSDASRVHHRTRFHCCRLSE